MKFDQPSRVFVDGNWQKAIAGQMFDVKIPSTGEVLWRAENASPGEF